MIYLIEFAHVNACTRVLICAADVDKIEKWIFEMSSLFHIHFFF